MKLPDGRIRGKAYPREDVRFITVPWLPWRDTVGMTLGPHTVLLKRGWENERWVREHELVHIRQYRRYGRFVFPVLYLFASVLYGYRLNPFEREAYGDE